MKKFSKANPLRVIVFRESKMWVAQGLEYDVGAQGFSLKELIDRLKFTYDLEETLGFVAMSVTPKRFYDMWDNSVGHLLLRSSTHPEISFAMTGQDGYGQ
jgi:hypothetical protein